MHGSIDQSRKDIKERTMRFIVNVEEEGGNFKAFIGLIIFGLIVYGMIHG